jgi:hypothetical protein
MKERIVFSLLAVSAVFASTAYAVSEDGSQNGMLFWVFVLFGALIVLAQLVPAILVIIGFIKGFSVEHMVMEKTGQGNGR